VCHPLHFGVRSLNGTVRVTGVTYVKMYRSWRKLFIRSVVATFCGHHPCLCMYADGCTGELNFGYVVGRLIDFGLSEISGYHSCGCEDVTKSEDSFS
jgi:hypothetical protein